MSPSPHELIDVLFAGMEKAKDDVRISMLSFHEDIEDGTFVLDKMFAMYFILLVPRRRTVVFDSSPNNDV